MYDNVVLRNHIKKYRYQMHFTQGELAELCGIRRQTICSIENYTWYPSAKIALIICQVLHKRFDEVFYLDFSKD